MVKIYYTGSKEEAQPFIKIVQSVIRNLPADVQKSIHLHCMIYFVDTTYGYSIGKPDYHIILLNINQMKIDNLCYKEQHYIIAHEFAHFVLNHMESSINEEFEANKLIAHWGFSKDIN